MKISVPRYKFDEMIKKISCETIALKGESKGTVMFQNKRYIITGSASSYNDGYISVFGNEAVPLSQYSGELKPLKYHEHNLAHDRNEREVGYNGMLIRSGTIQVVMIGKAITFVPVITEEQLSLF